MDPAEEQAQELDALAAIFEEEFKLLDAEADEQGAANAARFQISLDDPSSRLRARLVFRYTQRYPEEPPEMSVYVDEGMSEKHRGELLAALRDEATKELGMPMVYALHTFAKEWIAAHTANDAFAAQDASEMTFETRDLEAERRSEASNMKFHGTPVTADTFAAWQAAFEQEALAADASIIANACAADSASSACASDLAAVEARETGRQLFELSKAGVIDDSTAAFWENEAEEALSDDDRGTDYVPQEVLE